MRNTRYSENALVPVSIEDRLEDRLFDELIQEIGNNAVNWANSPHSEEFVSNVSDLISYLKISIREHKNPAEAALVSFKLATEIAKFAGPSQARKLLQRHDAMSIEIDCILTEITNEGKKPIPSLVWQRLIKRCGQEGNYLAQWRHETNKNDKPVLIWFGVTGNQEELTYEALKERLRRRKAR